MEGVQLMSAFVMIWRPPYALKRAVDEPLKRSFEVNISFCVFKLSKDHLVPDVPR